MDVVIKIQYCIWIAKQHSPLISVVNSATCAAAFTFSATLRRVCRLTLPRSGREPLTIFILIKFYSKNIQESFLFVNGYLVLLNFLPPHLWATIRYRLKWRAGVEHHATYRINVFLLFKLCNVKLKLESNVFYLKYVERCYPDERAQYT